ncbi:hypothetical protein, partial [Pseudoalteromonas sp. NEC-BIFX-2020_002]|uniref:hypothetical protein n=1 Tax=Pseudoalteromonas sp. NEC-BIFX-2020_002 TaxID=2732353 RepID=UPI001BB230C2
SLVTSVIHHLNTSTVGRALAREAPNDHAKLAIYNPSMELGYIDHSSPKYQYRRSCFSARNPE